MNRRAPRHAPQQMTREYNTTIAMMKVGTAPLDSLTDANLESIARTHCGRRPGDFDRLLAELRARLAERKGREAA